MGLISSLLKSLKGLGTYKGFAMSEAILVKQAYELVRDKNINPSKLYEEVLNNMSSLTEYDVSNILEKTRETVGSNNYNLQDVALTYIKIAFLRKVGGPPGLQRAQKLANATAELEEGVKEIISSDI